MMTLSFATELRRLVYIQRIVRKYGGRFDRTIVYPKTDPTTRIYVNIKFESYDNVSKFNVMQSIVEQSYFL